MTGSDRLSLAAVVAALAAGGTLAPVTEDRSYLLLAAALMLCSAVIGALLRRARAGEVLVRLAQLTPLFGVPWLVPPARDPVALYAQTHQFVQQAFAPMPFQVGFALFCALLLWLVYLLVETLAVGVAAPAWTFPVLVLPYLVPSLAVHDETSPWLFGFVATGYALVLATATASSLPTTDGRGDATAARWRRAVASTAALATALALAATLVLALPIPERSRTGGDNAGSGAVQLGDPSLDLIRNVNSNSDQLLLTYRSSDGGGQYLRLAALPVFDEAGFHLTATDLVPLPFGEDRPGGTEPGVVTTSVEVGALSTEYLPMPWFPLAAEVDATRWRYDPKTRAVVAIDTARTSATRNLDYAVSSARLPAAEVLLPALGSAGDPRDGGVTLQLPDAVSPQVLGLAQAVAARGVTAGEKALALAEYLRSGAFTYSTTAASGTTLGTLDDFLLGGRVGYCEQFAGSLAVMARAVGIPSRVVVGFLPGRRVGEEWQVTARNMHAWTELHFDGVGWVPVDATPSGAAGGPRPSASPTPSASRATPASTVPPTTGTPTVAPPPVAGGGGPLNAVPWLASVAGGLVLAAAGPRVVRAGLRRFRLAGAAEPRRASERAWAEVRAVVGDHGRQWPAGTSRQVAAQLGPQLTPAGRDALTALAITVERSRYDREPGLANEVARQVEEITAAMAERWPRPATRVWWPRSLWPWRPS